MIRREFLRFGAALSLAIGARPARAQAWPSRNIKVIVPFGVGGSADLYGRYMAEHLRVPLGSALYVENRPGAGATIGASAVVKSAPDGYTFLVMSNTLTANETLQPNRGYELLRDLVPIAGLNIAYNMLVVHPSVPAKTLPELIAYAKSQSGRLDYATSGPGTVYHIAGEIFRARAGIEAQPIPYRGSDQARNAVVAGSVQWMFDAIPTMIELVRAGQVRAIATTGLRRSPLLPEVPTIAETLPGFEHSIWHGVMAPSGTPKDIVDRMGREITRIFTAPAAREWQAKLGAQPMPLNSDEFRIFVQKDIETQRKLITDADIRIN